MPIQGVNDEILVTRAQAGDALALERLFRQRYPSLLRFARQFLRNDADASDAVQEAAVRMAQHLPRLQNAAAFPKWSHTIVRRCCLTLVAQRRANDLNHVSLGDDSVPVPEVATSPGGVEDSVDVGQIFRALGADAAEIIRLRLELGLSVREAAETLGISEGAIKVRLHRARREALRLAG
jgi:RNA polymerase sigma-70 factor (ECF subfamily)